MPLTSTVLPFLTWSFGGMSKNYSIAKFNIGSSGLGASYVFVTFWRTFIFSSWCTFRACSNLCFTVFSSFYIALTFYSAFSRSCPFFIKAFYAALNFSVSCSNLGCLLIGLLFTYTAILWVLFVFEIKVGMLIIIFSSCIVLVV